MKKLLLKLSAGVLLLTSCESHPAGTLQQIDKGNNENVEVYRYYFDDGQSVYVARFKDDKNVAATTWTERQGKIRVKKGSVVVFENDSIQVVLKK